MNVLIKTWSDELAVIAQRWADQCTYKHDLVRTLKDGTYVGQNIKRSSFRYSEGYDSSKDEEEVR